MQLALAKGESAHSKVQWLAETDHVIERILPVAATHSTDCGTPLCGGHRRMAGLVSSHWPTTGNGIILVALWPGVGFDEVDELLALEEAWPHVVALARRHDELHPAT